MLIIRVLLFIVGMAVSIEIYAGPTTLQFDISGVNPIILSNIQSRLKVEQKNSPEKLSNSNIQQFYGKTSQIIKEAMQPYGYFQPHIESTLTHHNEQYVAHIAIQAGRPLLVTSVDIKIVGPGKNNRSLQAWQQHFPIKTTDRLDIPIYQKTKQALFQIANNQGYIKAFLEKNVILIDLKKYQATIIIHLQTGKRYYFGKMQFTQSPYAKDFLQRFNALHTNKPFSSTTLLNLQQAMAASHYFTGVSLTPTLDQTENNHVPIVANTIAPAKQQYTVGAGYGTFTGPRLTLGANFNRLTDTGQHLEAQLRLSSVIYGLAAKYYIPGSHPLTDQWIIGTNYQQFTPQNGNSHSRSITGGYSKKYRDWTINANLNMLLDRFNVYNQPTYTSKLLYPSINLTYLKANDKVNPTTARSFSFTLQSAPSSLLTTTQFIQAELKGKFKWSPFSFDHIIVRGDLGVTDVHNLPAFPLTTRFFAGGLDSVRGYPDSSIGPGKYLEVGSLEYQNRIHGPLFASLFYDVGTATDHIGSRLNEGAGIGLGYESAIGPIKIYLAEAINKPGKPHTIEISLGPEF